MRQSINRLQGLNLQARDGEIGKVHDVYFDDKEWTVRYVVVDTGNWLTGRRVLLAPQAFGPADWQADSLPVDLTREQIENAPGIDADQPVSRQHEMDLSAYYGWSAYWTPLTPLTPTMPYVPVAEAADAGNGDEHQDHDPHLRSSREVRGYKIQARDGNLGQVHDLIVDDSTWRLTYLVVDTGGWLSGRQVIVSPSFVQRIDWDKSIVQVDLERETIQQSPEFDAETIGDEP